MVSFNEELKAGCYKFILGVYVQLVSFNEELKVGRGARRGQAHGKSIL